MSLLDDARQLLSGQDPRRNSTQLPPRGGAPRMEPSYVTGALEAPGGDRAQRVSSMYDAALKTREGERAAGILNAPALTSPVTENIPETSELSEATGYLGMGSKALSTGAEIANFADAPAVSSALETAGKVAGGVAGVFGAGVSAYNIAKGEGNPNDYMNVARTAAPYVKDVATTLAPEAMKTLTSVIPSGVASAVSIAAPYYALAKAGGMAINMITANNPQLKDTPLGHLGGSLEEPLAVERYWGGQLAQKGIGSQALHERANLVNPLEVGSFIYRGDAKKWLDTAHEKHKALTKGFLTGGITNFYDVGKHIGGKKEQKAIKAGLAVATGGLSEVFCFAEGTPITMADGTTKPVEEIDLFDVCQVGGMVNGKGVVLAEDIYDYEGVLVTGSHAVYEDDKWIRVKDSEKSIPVELDEPIKVYIVNNEDHVLIVNEIIFADYGEVTDSENMTADERLAYLNDYCSI